MDKIVLISCSSKKNITNTKTKAKDLYSSTLFKFNINYAHSLLPSKIFILSAKYGLVGLEDEIEYYNVTLNGMTLNSRKVWAWKVLNRLKEVSDLEEDEFIFLAGKKYREFIISHLKYFSTPLDVGGIGKQLQYLKSKINNKDEAQKLCE